jgi:hypothetical protein
MIPKLTSTNYLQWSSSMMDHFGACKIASIVLGEKRCPGVNDFDANEIEEWEANDSKARGAIKGACTPAMRTHIGKTATSAEMWTILAGHANSASSSKGRSTLLHQFQAVKAIAGEPLSNYFGKLTEIRDALHGTTHEISDFMFRQQVLRNLPSAYNTTKQIIENKDIEPSTQEVMDILKHRELDLQTIVTSGNSSNTTESALYTTTRPANSYRGSRGNFRGRVRQNTTYSNRTTPYSMTGMTCYNCGKKGHRAADCFQFQAGWPVGCFNCGESHVSRECPHTTLTIEQARKGRDAFISWSRYRDSRNLEQPSSTTGGSNLAESESYTALD